MPIILFILFITIALAILFFLHLLSYLSLVNLFDIVSQEFRLFLIIIFIFFPFSFIISSVLTHFKLNWFTRIYYFLSSLWLGVGVNFIIALVVSWGIFFLGRWLFPQFDLRTVYLLLLLLAVVYSGYGIWNATHPAIKRISVKIDNLPDSWQGQKIVQLSDVHLGHVFGNKFLQMVVDKVNDESVKAVFITGDLFDGMDGEFDVKVEPLNNLKTQHGTYFVTGNHETYFGIDKVKSILDKTSVIQMQDKAIDLDGLLVYGINSPMEMQKKNIQEIILEDPLYNKIKPSILLYHTPTNINQAKSVGINLQLSGHTHHGQIWPINYITYLVYGKYYSGFHTEENYNIYTSSGTGAWGPTMRTGHKPEITVITLN